jgi:hypothetical protein
MELWARVKGFVLLNRKCAYKNMNISCMIEKDPVHIVSVCLLSDDAVELHALSDGEWLRLALSCDTAGIT